MRRMTSFAVCALSLMLLLCASAVAALAQDGEMVAAQPREETAVFVSELGSKEPFVRQQAAEELARRADTDHLKMVEGYRLQEKNARVKLALDWALYRMGKSESLFTLVNALDSSQADQSVGYLTQLDSPHPLYIFLGRTKRVAQARLLEVLADVGDAETVERLKPLLESTDPTVAVAAEQATEKINNRIAQTPAEPLPSRPRTVGNSEETTP
jgi:HEAT repeat protein